MHQLLPAGKCPLMPYLIRKEAAVAITTRAASQLGDINIHQHNGPVTFFRALLEGRDSPPAPLIDQLLLLLLNLLSHSSATSGISS